MAKNKADRVAAERASETAATKRRSDQKRALSAEEQARRLAREIEAETKVVLRLLEDQGYPNMVQVWVERRTMFGGWKREQKAAWAIGPFSYDSHGDPQTGTMYLLSDGRIEANGARDLSDLYLRKYLPSVMSGVRALRRRLEPA